MTLHDHGTITTPATGHTPATTERGVVIELAPYSALVAAGNSRAWFDRATKRMHGLPADYAPVWQGDAIETVGITDHQEKAP